MADAIQPGTCWASHLKGLVSCVTRISVVDKLEYVHHKMLDVGTVVTPFGEHITPMSRYLAWITGTVPDPRKQP